MLFSQNKFVAWKKSNSCGSCIYRILIAHLCYLLFVINHQQGDREQDGSESLDGFLKPSCRGQLVALLKAGNQVGEAEPHGRKPLLRPTILQRYTRVRTYLELQPAAELYASQQLYLPVPLGMTTQTRQRGQAQVTGSTSRECLHEQRLVGVKVHNSNLVVEQLRNQSNTVQWPNLVQIDRTR